MSNDQYRKNMERNTARAARGGPEYRATGYGKGDVFRSVNKSAYDLGIEMMNEKDPVRKQELRILWDAARKAGR